jgi:hypothetical protein
MSTEKPDGPVLQAGLLVGRGFLLGVGFSVALGAAYYAMWHWTMHSVGKQTEKTTSTLDGHEVVQDIVLSSVEEVKHDGVTAILGTATNNGKKPAHGVHIQANLFNHGKFVDQYSTYLTGALDAGKSQYFKISCGCKDTPPAEHDSYKLEVLSGY